MDASYISRTIVFKMYPLAYWKNFKIVIYIATLGRYVTRLRDTNASYAVAMAMVYVDD